MMRIKLLRGGTTRWHIVSPSLKNCIYSSLFGFLFMFSTRAEWFEAEFALILNLEVAMIFNSACFEPIRRVTNKVLRFALNTFWCLQIMTEIQVDYVEELHRLESSNNNICWLKTNLAKPKYGKYRHLFLLRTIFKKKKNVLWRWQNIYESRKTGSILRFTMWGRTPFFRDWRLSQFRSCRLKSFWTSA